MKKIVLGLMAIVALFTVAGCEKKNNIGEIYAVGVSSTDKSSKLYALYTNGDPVELVSFDYIRRVFDVIDNKVYLTYSTESGHYSVATVDITTKEVKTIYEIDEEEEKNNKDFSFSWLDVEYADDNYVVVNYRGDVTRSSINNLKTGEVTEIDGYFVYYVSGEDVYAYTEDHQMGYKIGFYKMSLEGKNIEEVSKTEFYNNNPIYQDKCYTFYDDGTVIAETIYPTCYTYKNKTLKFYDDVIFDGKTIINAGEDEYTKYYITHISTGKNSDEVVVEKRRIHGQGVKLYGKYIINMSTGNYEFIDEYDSEYKKDFDIAFSRIRYVK